MTWSLEKPKIHSARMRPSVHWNGKPLWKLDDTEIEAAVTAAFALGDMTAAESANSVATGRPASELLPEATLIVGAIIAEMERRGIETVGDEND